jgi:hypothetical protein
MPNVYNFSFPGSASTPEVDDAETATVLETGEAGLTLPFDITIVDFLSDGSNAQLHQVSFWVNGRKVSGNLYTTQINPNNPGRLKLTGIVIKAGSRIQLKGSQKTGTAADPFKCTLVYV